MHPSCMFIFLEHKSSAMCSGLFFCYRTNLLGIDLNRAWHKISQWVHPVLYFIHNHLTEIDKNEVNYVCYLPRVKGKITNGHKH